MCGRGEAAPMFFYLCHKVVLWVMEKQVLLSTAYLPPISWFAALLKSETVFLEVHETYPKQTFRNRCNILGPNGKQTLSVPVSKPSGNNSKIWEVEITDHNNWKRLHWRAMLTAYNASPFFLYYRDRIEAALFRNHIHLWSLNLQLIGLIIGMLALKVHLIPTSGFVKVPRNAYDLRNIIHPKNEFVALQSFVSYPQVFSAKYPFIPDLSIVDLLFNEGPAARDYVQDIASLIHL